MNVLRHGFALLAIALVLSGLSFASNACVALDLVEVAAALPGPGDIVTIHVELPDKKQSLCDHKRIVGGRPQTGAAWAAAPGPEVVLLVPDAGAPPLVDAKTMEVEQFIPALGDRASVANSPVSTSSGTHTTYRVSVVAGARSYILLYTPSAADQNAQETAIQLAREVLLMNYLKPLGSRPIAERALASEKDAAAKSPNDVGLWNQVALRAFDLKHFEDVHDAYLTLSHVLPDDPGGYYGVAMADWSRSYQKRMQVRAALQLRGFERLSLDPRYKEQCDSFRKDFRPIIEEGYESIKKALQMQPDGRNYAAYASLLATEKADTDCGDSSAVEADSKDAEHFAALTNTAQTGGGNKYVSKIALPPYPIAPPPPPPPGAMPGNGLMLDTVSSTDTPVAAPGTGGVLGSVLSTTPGISGTSIPGRVRVSSGILEGLIANRVAPVYPALARRARIQGTVLLKAEISRGGDIENLELISGHPMLVNAAIDAVKQWKYKPFLLNGKAAQVETTIQVNFTLAPN